MKKYIGLFLVCVACHSSDEKIALNHPIQKNNKIDGFQWLLGSWQNLSVDGNTYETWALLNDSTLSGKGLVIKDKDTLFSESITLFQQGEDVFYSPIVSDQNEGKSISFKLTSHTNNQFIFENLTHDFPTKITYTQVSPDSLLAEISGLMDGEMRTEKFPFGRKK